MTDDKGAGEGPYGHRCYMQIDPDDCVACSWNDGHARGIREEREMWTRILSYAQHRDYCGDMDAHNNADAPSCNCGLDGLKDEIRGGQDGE